MATANEQLVLDFIHAAYGQKMDVDAMVAMMADDFVWQLNVPRSKIVRGRDAAREELALHSELSTGMVGGSEIQTVVSSGDTVVVERIDVNEMGDKAVSFNVCAIFDVRDGKLTCWREYWDTGHIAQQLGIDAVTMFDALET